VHQGVALGHLDDAVDALEILARHAPLYVLKPKGEMFGEGRRGWKGL
jgi:hypothetical protein